jgi:hypothetical protein
MRLARSRHYIGVTTLGFVAAHSSAMTEVAERTQAEFETVVTRERGRLFGIAFDSKMLPTVAHLVLAPAPARTRLIAPHLALAATPDGDSAGGHT